ncbi:hypothetical protein HRbin22_01611 [Candidatus Thermoflexus japonica]|uniref:Uncharacterized protein n=1 Tax=Candidatus Thermoflexus japonica TaxID=2035417 RepID=A0A2H5Y7E7_9CHLR|nr:hypothetical protein HRbin22_01611 [Candidatus Thermoflexus japonica]
MGFPFPEAMKQLQPYRHRMPVIVAVEPELEAGRRARWEAVSPRIAEAGAALVVLTPEPAALRGAVVLVDPGLFLSAVKGPQAWVLDAYLEPRVCLDTSRLDPGLLDRILAWVEGIQHECPE